MLNKSDAKNLEWSEQQMYYIVLFWMFTIAYCVHVLHTIKKIIWCIQCILHSLHYASIQSIALDDDYFFITVIFLSGVFVRHCLSLNTHHTACLLFSNYNNVRCHWTSSRNLLCCEDYNFPDLIKLLRIIAWRVAAFIFLHAVFCAVRIVLK